MSSNKSPATNKNPKTPENPVQVLKEATCPTLSGADKTQLTYQILSDDAGDIYIKVTGNKGGGFWASENTPYAAIDDLIANIGGDESLTAWALRPLFVGKSSNSPGYLLSVLRAEGLVKPLPGKKRLHIACDPAVFLADVQELMKGAGKAVKKKTAAKANTATRPSAKTPRKSPATSRKGK